MFSEIAPRSFFHRRNVKKVKNPVGGMHDPQFEPHITYTCLQITKMENISSETDVIKANLYLVAIIGSFVILTCIAYIFNEGRHICVIPLLRRYRPRCRWVLQQDRLLAENEEKHLVELDLAQHVKHFGMKKSSRAPSATPS